MGAQWQEHLDSLVWRQGEHVLVAGPTGSGKTTMAAQLLNMRSHSIMFVSKIHDPIFKSDFRGWKRIERWPKRGLQPWDTRILLWPRRARTIGDTLRNQREVFREALEAVFRQGNRCVCIDETLMFADPKFLGLGSPLGLLHYFGRSSGTSLLTLCQRPAWIPKVIYSSVSHAYIARTRDRLDLRRLSDLGGTDVREVERQVMTLPTRHDFLYVNSQGDAPNAVVNIRK